MFKKITALILISSMALTLFACGKDENPTDNKESTEKVTNASGETAETVTNTSGETIELGNDKIEYNTKMPSGLKATKIGTITDDINIYALFTSDNADGFYYKASDGKYGIMSLDGKSDTGAKYTVCSAEDKYFCVTTVDPASVTEIEDLNCMGLVDVNGKVLVPMQYAAVSVISDRYVRVSTVDNTTDDKTYGLVFISNNDMFPSIHADSDDTLLSGKWEIYDLTTGKTIPGISGTKAYSMTVYGNIINYTPDEKNYAYTNEKGETLEHHSYFDNGCYVVSDRETETYKLYNSDGKELFSGSTDDFVPNGVIGEYLKAQKYVDGEYTYALMDMNGKIVSGEFKNNIISQYGSLYYCSGETTSDHIYCNSDGEQISPDGYNALSFEDTFGFAWSVKSGDKTAIIDAEGNIVLDNIEDQLGTYFVAEKKIDSVNYCYSYKDKDYTIKGSGIAPWLVKNTEDYSSYSIYDTISGEKIIDGYKQFDVAVDKGEGIYIYAESSDGSTDIYFVK